MDKHTYYRASAPKIIQQIGMNNDNDFETEIEKAHAAKRFKVDIISDCSMGGNIHEFHTALNEVFPNAISSVPIYEYTVLENSRSYNNSDALLRIISDQCSRGVRHLVIHSLLNLELLESALKANRNIFSSSRGGALLCRWMKESFKENPFFSRFKEIYEIAVNHDTFLHLISPFRSAAIVDFSYDILSQELNLMSQLLDKISSSANIVYCGIGHIPFIEFNGYIDFVRKKSGGIPMRIMGPLFTDVGIGYEDYLGSIGYLFSALKNVEYVTTITASEHVRTPPIDEIAQCLRYYNLVKQFLFPSIELEDQMAKAKSDLDWNRILNSCIFPEKIAPIIAGRESGKPCTICGNCCPLLICK